MLTNDVPLTRTRTVIAIVILTVAVILGTFVVDAHGAGASPSKTPHSCKVALNDAAKVFGYAGDGLTVISNVIKLVPSMMIAVSENDNATINQGTVSIKAATAQLNDDNAKIAAIAPEFKTARDKCLAG